MQRPNTVITVAAWPISILSSNGKRGKQGGPNFYSTLPSGKEGIQYLKSGPIDLILGFYGVAYRKHFFYKSLQIDPLLFSYAKRPEFATHCTYVDDIWFSGHLERLRVPRYVIGKVDDSKAGVTPLTNVDALSLDQGLTTYSYYPTILSYHTPSAPLTSLPHIIEKTILFHLQINRICLFDRSIITNALYLFSIML